MCVKQLCRHSNRYELCLDQNTQTMDSDILRPVCAVQASQQTTPTDQAEQDEPVNPDVIVID